MLAFLTLKIHSVVDHAVDLAFDGVENAVIVGPKGAGKSDTVRRALERLDRSELQEAITKGRPARGYLSFETARSEGKKTALSDIYDHLQPETMSRRSRPNWTPTQYIEQIVAGLVDEKKCVISIDEAQLIDPRNLEHLRQIPDVAEGLGWKVRLILIGNELLESRIAETGQRGERFPTILRVPPFSAAEVAPHLGGMHPDIAAIQDALSAKEWQKLVTAVMRAANGSFRRLNTIFENAHAFARKRGTPMTARDVEIAIDKLVEP